MPTPRRKTPRPPQRIWSDQERRTVVSHAAPGRQRSSSNRGLRQAAERAKKETMRTIEAAQAKSQAGIGRACLATSAWASGRSKVTGGAPAVAPLRARIESADAPRPRGHRLSRPAAGPRVDRRRTGLDAGADRGRPGDRPLPRLRPAEQRAHAALRERVGAALPRGGALGDRRAGAALPLRRRPRGGGGGGGAGPG